MTPRDQAPPPPGRVPLALPGGRSLLLHRRSAITAAILLVIALAVSAATVLTGEYDLSAGAALDVLRGGGNTTDRFIVVDQRLPRAVAAMVVGAALAASGAIFQSLSRNALASPDVVGFTTGAAFGGLLAIIVVGRSTTATVMTGAIAGGAAAAFIVAVIGLRRGMAGDRLIVAGIAVAAMLAAVNDYLISRAPLEDAEAAKAWQHGSLHNITWPDVWPAAVLAAIGVAAAFTLVRGLRGLELGDDVGAGIGVDVRRLRPAAIAVGLVLAAGAVATAGPIGFLALAAPQLARRVARAPGIAFGPALAMGALLLAVADLLAQRLLSPFQIPVGLVTAALGGGYLLWLLVADRA